jgi:hypothetical protein
MVFLSRGWRGGRELDVVIRVSVETLEDVMVVVADGGFSNV